MSQEHDLRRLSAALAQEEITLCRMGKKPEWVALGLDGTPTLHYHQGRWQTRHPWLQKTINHTLRNRHGKRNTVRQ